LWHESILREKQDSAWHNTWELCMPVTELIQKVDGRGQKL
jgi:hypothetical protein